MKAHDELHQKQVTEARRELYRAFAVLASEKDVRAFLLDLCTPAEIEAMADRWRVIPLLKEGRPYREIHDLTGVSVTTIGRVARFLESGNGGYEAVYAKLYNS